MICTGSPVWADVSLEIPRNITIVAKNGKAVKIDKRAMLPDGDNQIVVQFQGELSRKYADEDADFEYSDTFVMRFNSSNQALKMVIPRIKRLSELERWNEKPDIRILDPAGRRLDVRTARLEKDGIQFFRDYEKELEAFNKTDSPAALPAGSGDFPSPAPRAALVPAAAKPSVPAAAEPSPEHHPRGKAGMAEDMLEYWYQQADEKARARFKERINKQ